MIRRPPRSTQSRSSAASDVYKRQVLRRLAGPLESDLLSLLLTRIACQEVALLQGVAELLVESDESSRYAVAHRASLAAHTAANHAHHDIEPVGRARQPHRFQHRDLMQVTTAEVFLARLAVHGNVAFTGIQANAGDR